ncbi:hypothetical protein [Saccharothrix texasensis]|uniref:Uncharacterized protein n=1 Tax=Saccharothrix texasensis TaxID=103734 RepID=A0A3N1H1L2_9PSEU|nr:hypothetical protein EDD40_1674 [Saccharothrix texasensis]
MTVTIMDDELNFRARALLRAVAAGRAEVTRSCEPDLKVDGLLCSDQGAAREPAHAGLLRPARRDGSGPWVPAELTAAGRAVLA